MSTRTPNLNLINPVASEKGVLTTYNTNNNIIDNAYGDYLDDQEQSLENIAPIEGSTASTNYSVGSYLVKDGVLYKVTAAIASGESIVAGTNVIATSLNEAVVELNTAVASIQSAISTLQNSVYDIVYTYDTITCNSTGGATSWNKTITKAGYYPISYAVYHSNAANWLTGAESVNPQLGRIECGGYYSSTGGNNYYMFIRVTWMKAL